MIAGNSQEPHKNKLILRCAFVLYTVLLAIAICRHELWCDELHSWNIAKASNTLVELLRNSRYEGHPPLWYLVLWLVSRFTQQPVFIQVLQFFIASGAVYLLVFRSPLPVWVKALAPFGYFLLFEYGALSRNYALGILLAFAICMLLSRQARKSTLTYYVLLFLLSNTHLLGLALALSLHVYFVLCQQRKKPSIVLHSLAGLVVSLPALYFIKPPADSSLGLSFWNAIDLKSHLTDIIRAPIRSILPMPAWWHYNFWNTNFLIDGFAKRPLSLAIQLIFGMLLISSMIFCLRRSKAGLVLFLSNLILTILLGLVVPLTSTRYTGFLFIGWLSALWISYARDPTRQRNGFITALIVLQIPSGLYAATRDFREPFSRAACVPELFREVPAGEPLVTDYWCLNMVVAYTNQPAYCLDLGRELRFIQWKQELLKAIYSRRQYTDGLTNLFNKGQQSSVYMISMNSMAEMAQKDTALMRTYHLQLLDKRDGAIEKSGNLYLYRITLDSLLPIQVPKSSSDRLRK